MPALCLSPSSLQAQRASRRLCDAEGGILFGQAVTTLPRLLPVLLAAAGDRRPVLTPLSEELLALEAGEAAGGAFSGLFPGSGLARALARTVRELRRGEVGAGDLTQVAAGLSGAPARRLGLLAAALGAFEARLDELGVLDAPAAARAAAVVVRRGPAGGMAAADLLILDGFVSLAPAEWELLAALLARARRSRVSLPFFPDRPDLCAPAEPLLRRLESLHELSRLREIEVVLPRLDEGRAPQVAALLSAFAGGAADRQPGGAGQVLAAPGAGEAGELTAAADVALRLLEGGLAPEDVVVFSPSPGRAAAPLRAAFRARGLPLATGRGPAAADVPLVRLLLEAQEAAGGLGRTAAVRLAGSSWFLPGGGIAGLPALLERAGAIDGRGPAVAALRRRALALSGRGSRERARLNAVAEELEALEATLSPLSRPATARDHARHLAAVVGALGVRRKAARGPLEVAAEDLAALRCLDDAAEEVARATGLCGRGAAMMSPAEFAAWLGLALAPLALPLRGEPAAGAVELLGPEELGGAPARAAIVLGCSEGTFPGSSPPEPLLREPERQAIDRHLRRQAVATASARRAEALHKAFLSAAAGTEVVAFAWAAPGPAGDGGPPSGLLVEALTAVGVVTPEGAPPEPLLPFARTARSALRAAARLGRTGVAALSETPLAGRAGEAVLRGELEAGRRAAVLAGVSGPWAGGVSGPALDLLRATLPEEWTPSQLEGHAHCPFRALVRLGFALPDEAAPDLDMEPRDEGTLLHALLERFVSQRVARGAWPPSGSADDLLEARRVAAGVLSRFEREGRTGDPAAWAGRREGVLHRLDRIVIAEARDHDGLTPRLLEHTFGGGAAAPALSLGAGGQVVKLRGRIDRVDEGPGRLLVIDYKNARGGGSREELLDPEAFGVKSFQVPAYLLAAARELPGRTLAATYALLRAAERLEPVELSPDDPRLSKEGLGTEGFAAAVVARVGRMREGEFPIVSQGCERCPFGAVCRFEGLAARAAEEP